MAQPPILAQDENTIRQYVLFQLHDTEFGVPIEQVWRIVPYIQATRVPHAPPEVEGLINLHGEIIPVINLKYRLGLPPSSYSEDTRILVVETDEQRVGLTVDRVTTILRVPISQVAPAPPLLDEHLHHLGSQIATVEDRIIVLLNVHDLITTTAETIATAVSPTRSTSTEDRTLSDESTSARPGCG